MTTLRGSVTISKVSDNTIRIRIRDEASSTVFVEAVMSLEGFASAITGLGEVDAKIEVRGLDTVGKKMITERRSIVCPLKTYDKGKLEKWLRDNAQEDGWSVNAYLGSQNSVAYHENETVLNYSVTKYVSGDES